MVEFVICIYRVIVFCLWEVEVIDWVVVEGDVEVYIIFYFFLFSRVFVFVVVGGEYLFWGEVECFVSFFL